MAQAEPSNARYPDGASRSIRDPHSMGNVARLVQAVTRQPGISEITLQHVFTPGDFFTGQTATLLRFSYRIPEVIRVALAQGVIRALPTSHPDYTAYYPVHPVNRKKVAA